MYYYEFCRVWLNSLKFVQFIHLKTKFNIPLPRETCNYFRFSVTYITVNKQSMWTSFQYAIGLLLGPSQAYFVSSHWLCTYYAIISKYNFWSKTLGSKQVGGDIAYVKHYYSKMSLQKKKKKIGSYYIFGDCWGWSQQQTTSFDPQIHWYMYTCIIN